MWDSSEERSSTPMKFLCFLEMVTLFSGLHTSASLSQRDASKVRRSFYPILEIQQQLNGLETNLLRDEKLKTALEDELGNQKQETHWSQEGLLEIREEYGEEEELKIAKDDESDEDDDFETKLKKNQMKITKINHPELLEKLEGKSLMSLMPEPVAKTPADLRRMME